MRYGYDEQQRAIAETTRGLLSRELGSAGLHAAVEQDPAIGSKLWQRIAETGMLGLLTPEDHGGGGGSLVDFCAFAEEAGRALLPGPWLETAVLAPLAVTSSGAANVHAEWLAAWAGGTKAATLAHHFAAEPDDPVVAEPTSSGFRLRGSKPLVPFGDTAAAAVVTATLDEEPALFLVPLADGVHASPHESVDPRERLAALAFDVETPATSLLATGQVARDVLHRVLAAGTALRCAEMLGGARAVTDTTVEHVRSREQFGQPIGAFQAIKHRLATAAMLVENVAACAYAAIWAVEHDDDVDAAVSVAKAYSSEAYIEVCRTAVQLHGGYGFTWEATVHLYLKHARRCASTFGTSAHHLDSLASRLLD